MTLRGRVGSGSGGGGSGTVTSVGLTSTGGTIAVGGGPVTTNGNINVDINGPVSVANGGTGSATLTGIVKGNGTSPMTAAAGADVAAALGTTNISGNAANVTGVVAPANGGTGLSAIGAAGQVLTVNAGATALTWTTPSGGGGGSGIQVLGKQAAPQSVTATTTETALYTLTVQANTMGLSGGIRVSSRWTITNNADIKNLHVRLGGLSGIDFMGWVPSTLNTVEVVTVIQNRGAANQQLGARLNNSFGGSTSAFSTANIDTTVDQQLVLSGKLTSTADTITLESVLVEAF